ncbi:MAG: bifunctional metallophosphatase/5'-nucleotidase [Gemmatimonadota bacterium]|nr:bifunctional metallophosphatase/5'-nucleotidase [Gemmatimonadota bacterium]
MSRLLVLVALLAACARTPTPATLPAPAADQLVRVTLLHINDVYEITPVEGGRSGGLARVAALRHRLIAGNPNIFFTLGGDFFSPSALGTAVVDGERLGGRQMVAVLNTAGLDLAVFGNHEFDIRGSEFLSRLGESRFGYLATNVTDSTGQRFPRTASHYIVTFRNPSGQSVRIGFIGSVIASNPQPYVRYTPWLERMREEALLLRDSVDVLIGLTHLGIGQDIRLAEEIPELDLILGGHEHENWMLRRGTDLTPILKADANVRTVGVIELTWDPATRRVRVDPQIVAIGDTLPEDPIVAAEVHRWTERGYAGFRAIGFEPGRVVAISPEALEGRESFSRNQPSNLTSLIAAAFFAEAGDADLALFNTGSVRVDDVIHAGPVTEYDLIRILPFGGNAVLVSITGTVLQQVLDQGEANRGSGGYLAHFRVRQAVRGGWLIGEQPLDPTRSYRVAMTDFLVSGRERGLGFLNLQNPAVQMVREMRDVRLALKDEMVRRWGR